MVFFWCWFFVWCLLFVCVGGGKTRGAAIFGLCAIGSIASRLFPMVSVEPFLACCFLVLNVFSWCEYLFRVGVVRFYLSAGKKVEEGDYTSRETGRCRHKKWKNENICLQSKVVFGLSHQWPWFQLPEKAGGRRREKRSERIAALCRRGAEAQKPWGVGRLNNRQIATGQVNDQ